MVQSGKTTIPPPPSGNLDKVFLPDLLNMLYTTQGTGLLRLSNGKAFKAIHMRKGMPVWLETNIPRETLVAYLVERRLLSRDACPGFEEIESATNQKASDLILSKRYMQPHDLFEVLNEYLRMKILGCFVWDQGEYEFMQVQSLPENIAGIKVDVARLIIDGVTRLVPKSRIERHGALSLSLHVAPHPESPFNMEQLPLTREEQRIFQLAASGIPIEEVCTGTGSHDQVVRFLLALKCLGIIRFTEKPVISKSARCPSMASSKTPSVPPAKMPSVPPGKTPSVPPRPSVRSENPFFGRHDQFEDMDHFQLLGIGRSASTDDVRKAYRDLWDRFDPAQFSRKGRETPSLTPAMLARMDKLRDRLKDAHDTLSNVERRRKYVESLARGAAFEADEKTPPRPSETGSRPSKGRASFQAGMKAMASGNIEQAMKAFQRAVDENGEDALPHAYLGWSVFMQNPKANASEAEEHLKMAIMINPNLDMGYYFLGRILASKGKADEALEYFETAVQLNPKNHDARREIHLHEKRKGASRPPFEFAKRLIKGKD